MILRARGRFASGRWRSPEKALGPEHPDSATSLSNLSRLMSESGYTSDAETLFKRAIAIGKKPWDGCLACQS